MYICHNNIIPLWKTFEGVNFCKFGVCLATLEWFLSSLKILGGYLALYANHERKLDWFMITLKFPATVIIILATLVRT